MTLRNKIHKSTLFTLCLCLYTLCIRAQSYEVNPVDINSTKGDFGSVRYKDGLVFCSSRLESKLPGDFDTAHFYTDLFYSKLLPNRKFDNPILFSSELTDILNEGPATFSSDFQTIYYTSNLDPQKKIVNDIEENVYSLGICMAKRAGDKWVRSGALPFNSKTCDFSIAHPCLSPNDSILYFASNMFGTHGGSDIFYCVLRNGQWSQPINAGPTINTSGNEAFPFCSREGLLYFCSDGHHKEADRHDMDIYFTKSIGSFQWMEPRHLPFPMNTAFNDYAYSEFNNGEFGFLSSDRQEKRDKIYSFSKSTPTFFDCQENNRTTFCYRIEDNKIDSINNLPLVYQWELGDGNILEGKSIEHCYEKPGVYQLHLNLLDTITDQVILSVSSTVLEIVDYQQPFILSNDTGVVHSPMVFYSDDSPLSKFKVVKHFWIIDDQVYAEGDSLMHVFKEPGYHTILCGAVGETGQDGSYEKSCSYKTIYISEKPIDGYPKANPDPNQEPIEVITVKTDLPDFTEGTGSSTLLYRVVILKSNERIPMNYQGFASLTKDIVETKDSTGTYTYSFGVSAELDRIYEQMKEAQSTTNAALSLEIFNHDNFAKEYIRKGKYIPQGDAAALNVEFMKLRDIKFEYNSAEIKSESFANLDYIASMLKLESGFTLKINAHTCSQGTHEYNQDLSQKRAASVKSYFVKKGIPTSRLITEGYAETMPIANNNTEEGKAMNRRVEFVIVFNPEINESDKE